MTSTYLMPYISKAGDYYSPQTLPAVLEHFPQTFGCLLSPPRPVSASATCCLPHPTFLPGGPLIPGGCPRFWVVPQALSLSQQGAGAKVHTALACALLCKPMALTGWCQKMAGIQGSACGCSLSSSWERNCRNTCFKIGGGWRRMKVRVVFPALALTRAMMRL